nr:MAG TPA: hypothetical protein [Caudoviricetes sp.]
MHFDEDFSLLANSLFASFRLILADLISPLCQSVMSIFSNVAFATPNRVIK